MPDFQIVSPYKMAGDQPEAVAKLVEGIQNGLTEQTLMGVTGSRQDLHHGQGYRAGCSGRRWCSRTIRRWPRSSAASCGSSSRTTRSSISCPITTITSPRPISPRPIPISKRTRPSTTRSTRLRHSATSALCRAAGRDHRRFRVLHLRAGRPDRLQEAWSISLRPGMEIRPRRAYATAGRHPVRAQRHRL